MANTGSPQRLIADLEFLPGKLGPLAPGETRTVPHGLHEAIGGSPRPVKPTSVLPDCATPIIVTAADELTITVNNPTTSALATTFRVERVHTIHENPRFADDNVPVEPPFTMLLWQGNCGDGQGPPGPPGAGAVLFWGNDSIAAAADTRFLTPGHGGVAPLTNLARVPIPRAGTLRNLVVRHNSPAGNGGVVTYLVRVNGVATPITIGLATGAVGVASDIVNSFAVVLGDDVSISAMKPNLGSGGIDVEVALELA